MSLERNKMVLPRGCLATLIGLALFTGYNIGNATDIHLHKVPSYSEIPRGGCEKVLTSIDTSGILGKLVKQIEVTRVYQGQTPLTGPSTSTSTYTRSDLPITNLVEPVSFADEGENQTTMSVMVKPTIDILGRAITLPITALTVRSITVNCN